MEPIRVFLFISLSLNLLVVLVTLFFILGGWKILFNSQKKIRVELLASLADYNRGNSIVFLGDSITEGFPIEEFFPNEYILNRGIGGDTTTDVLNRLERHVLLIKPRKVLILLGINDLGNEQKTPSFILENFKMILDRISTELPETKIYVETVLPINPTIKAPMSKYMTRHRKNTDIAEINRGLLGLCNNIGCTLIDTVSPMSDAQGYLKSEYTKEGLHLTLTGYHALTEILTPYVKE